MYRAYCFFIFNSFLREKLKTNKIMKNAITLILIIVMIISGAILLDKEVYFTGGTLVALGVLLLTLYPLITDFIKNK